MSLRMNSTWLWLVITALTVLFAGESNAWAGAIVVKIGQQPGGGDPPYDYVIEAFLEPGFKIDYENSFYVDMLKGVTSGSFTTQPINIADGIAWSPQITQEVTTYPYASKVTWFFTGLTPYDNTKGTQPIDLGTFQVKTTVSFSSPPNPPLTPIVYGWSVLDSQGNLSTGTGIALLGIPEPTSALLLLTGIGILPVVAFRRQRRTLREQP